MNKKLTAVGLTAGLIAGAGAGLILEASGSAGAASQPAAAAAVPDDDTDSESGPDAADRPDPSERLQEVLQPLVEDGTITQAQADAVIEALQAAAPKGGRPGGPGGHGRGPGFAIVAETLGLTEQEVRDAIIGCQTLAELAAANGSSAEELVDAILADIKSKIDEKVAAGDLTQEEADERLAEAETRVTEFVNNTKPPKGPRGPGGPGGPGAEEDAPAEDGS